MLEAERDVCIECGCLQMEGRPAPDHGAECVVWGDTLTEVEMPDLIDLKTGETTHSARRART